MTTAFGLLMRGKEGVRSMTNEIVLDKEFRACSIYIEHSCTRIEISDGPGAGTFAERAPSCSGHSRRHISTGYGTTISARSLHASVQPCDRRCSDQRTKTLSSQCAMPQQGTDQADCCVDRALRLRESGADGRRRRDCCGPWSCCRGEAAWSREGPGAAPLAPFGGRATRLRDRRQQIGAKRGLGPRDTRNRAAGSCCSRF